jgi:hypothetical protein
VFLLLLQPPSLSLSFCDCSRPSLLDIILLFQGEITTRTHRLMRISAFDATPQRQRFNYGRDKTTLYVGLAGANATKFAFKVMTEQAFSSQK